MINVFPWIMFISTMLVQVRNKATTLTAEGFTNHLSRQKISPAMRNSFTQAEHELKTDLIIPNMYLSIFYRRLFYQFIHFYI